MSFIASSWKGVAKPATPITRSSVVQYLWSLLEPFPAEPKKRKRWCRFCSYLVVVMNLRNTGVGADRILALFPDVAMWDPDTLAHYRRTQESGHWSKPLQRSALYSIKLNANRLFSSIGTPFVVPFVHDSFTMPTQDLAYKDHRILEAGRRYVTLGGFDPNVPDTGTTLEQSWYSCGAEGSHQSCLDCVAQSVYRVPVQSFRTPAPNRAEDVLQIIQYSIASNTPLLYRTRFSDGGDMEIMLASYPRAFGTRPILSKRAEYVLDHIRATDATAFSRGMFMIPNHGPQEPLIVPPFDAISIFWIFYQSNARVFLPYRGAETVKSLIQRVLGPPQQNVGVTDVDVMSITSCSDFRQNVRYRFLEKEDGSEAEGLVLLNTVPREIIIRVVFCYDNDQEVGRSMAEEMMQPSNCSKEPMQYMISEYVRARFPYLTPPLYKFVTVVLPESAISLSMGWTRFRSGKDDWPVDDKTVAKKVWALSFIACQLGVIGVEHMDLLSRNVVFTNPSHSSTVQYSTGEMTKVVVNTPYAEPQVLDFEYAVVRSDPVLMWNESRETAVGDSEFMGLTEPTTASGPEDFGKCKNVVNRSFCFRPNSVGAVYRNMLDVMVNTFIVLRTRWPSMEPTLVDMYRSGADKGANWFLQRVMLMLDDCAVGWSGNPVGVPVDVKMSTIPTRTTSILSFQSETWTCR